MALVFLYTFAFYYLFVLFLWLRNKSYLAFESAGFYSVYNCLVVWYCKMQSNYLRRKMSISPLDKMLVTENKAWLFFIADIHDCLSLQIYMTVYHCRHIWLFIIADTHDLFIVADIHDCLSLQIYMTDYHCRHTWLFIIADIHDCLSLQIYMTVYHFRQTWLFIIADIHDCLSLQTYMTVYHCRYAWLFITANNFIHDFLLSHIPH